MRISDWSSDVCSSDLETVGVGIVEDAFAFAEQILDQVAVAQFGVRHLFHHHGMGGVIGLGKHGIASSLEIIWLAALLVLMVTGVKGVGTLAGVDFTRTSAHRSEEHTSELQSLMRISYAVFCLQKKTKLT